MLKFFILGGRIFESKYTCKNFEAKEGWAYFARYCMQVCQQVLGGETDCLVAHSMHAHVIHAYVSRYRTLIYVKT